MTARGRKKGKLGVRTGHLLYTDAFQNLRMVIYFESRAPQYALYGIQHPSLFPLMYTEKAFTKRENFNGAAPKLENYSWSDPLVQDLQIISVSFRSHTKKHLH